MPRRTSHALLAALAVALMLPAATKAAPTVSLHAVAAPIPRNLDQPHGAAWPHTGNRVAGAAELEATATIHGSEDLGLPNPLRRIALSLPNGVKLNHAGFGRCRLPHGNWYLTGNHPRCPSGTMAGSLTVEQTSVHIESSRVLPAPISRQLFFQPRGGLGMWELVAAGWLGGLGAEHVPLKRTENHRSVFGYTLSITPPYRRVMETGQDLSADSFTIAIGAATESGGRLHSYLTLPERCPPGGWSALTLSLSDPRPGRLATA